MVHARGSPLAVGPAASASQRKIVCSSSFDLDVGDQISQDISWVQTANAFDSVERPSDCSFFYLRTSMDQCLHLFPPNFYSASVAPRIDCRPTTTRIRFTPPRPDLHPQVFRLRDRYTSSSSVVQNAWKLLKFSKARS